MVDIKKRALKLNTETIAKDYWKMFEAKKKKRCLIKLQTTKDRNLLEKLFQVNFANESDSFMTIIRSAWRNDIAFMMFIDLYLFASFVLTRQEFHRAVVV